MPASRARKLSQLMSEGGSLDTQIDSSGTTSEIGSGGVTVIGSPENFPATNTATDGDMVLVTDINKLFVFNGSGWDSVSMVQNQSPAIITPISDQTFATGDSAITVQLAATDPEGLLLTWVISESDPNQNICNIQLNQSNIVSQYSTLTITPTSDTNVADSSFNVTATGYDNSGNSTSDVFQVELVNGVIADYAFCVNALGGSVYGNIFRVNGVNTTFSRAGNPPLNTTTLSLDTSRTIQYVDLAGSGTEYVNLGNIDFTTGASEDFTMEYWMYSTSSGAYHQVINDGNSFNVDVWKYGSNNVYYWYSNGTFSTPSLTHSANDWYHIIIQGDKATNTIHYWKDGAYVGGQTGQGGWWTAFSSFANFTINGTSSESYPMSIGELKIYKGYQKYTPNTTASWADIFSVYR